MIAALYVQLGGSYFGLDGVDPWDEARDARLYPGPHPVVAHPPCAAWCRLAYLREARHPHLKRGEDGGCFAAALASVRRWGGVLEHPAFSDAFTAYGLPIPDSRGGWQRGICGGWSCYVEQGRYGHPAKKGTWLYVYGVDSPPSLRWGRIADRESEALVSWCGNHTTEKRWALVSDGGSSADHRRRAVRTLASGEPLSTSRRRRLMALVATWPAGTGRRRLMALVSGATWPAGTGRRRLSPKEASATPAAFLDVLLDLARRVHVCAKSPRVVRLRAEEPRI